MSETQANNPMHGVTLEKMVTRLVEHYGWEILGQLINIRCFTSDPSVKSQPKILKENALGQKEGGGFIFVDT